MTKSRGILPPRKPWTDAEVEILRRDYPNIKTEKIAAALGRGLHTVYAQAAKLGLKKSAAYLASPDACRLRRDSPVGVPFRFKPGQVPPNKGLRRPGYAPGRMRVTQFKKGQMPHNWRYPIGATKLIDGYQYTKLREASPWTKAWKLTHYLLWEAAGRSIPTAHALVFKDGNRQNITLDNLQCVHRSELAKRNHWKKRLPPDLQQVIVLRSAIKAQITKRLKNDGQRHRRSEEAPVRNARPAQRQGQAARHRTSKCGV